MLTHCAAWGDNPGVVVVDGGVRRTAGAVSIRRAGDAGVVRGLRTGLCDTGAEVVCGAGVGAEVRATTIWFNRLVYDYGTL